MELNEPVPVVKSQLHLVTRRSKRVIRLLSTLTGHKNPWARDAKEKPPRDRGPLFFDCERLKVLLRHPEHHVALKRVLGRHFDRAGGRA
jgi:hypothetical protein